MRALPGLLVGRRRSVRGSRASRDKGTAAPDRWPRRPGRAGGRASASSSACVVVRDLEQVGLDERHVALGEDQAVGEVLGAHAAVLVEGRAALLGHALDARLDRDAAGGAEQLEQLRLPEVDPGLHAESRPGARPAPRAARAAAGRSRRRNRGRSRPARSAGRSPRAPDRGGGGGSGRESAAWRRSCSCRGSRARPRPRRRGRRARARSGDGDDGAPAPRRRARPAAGRSTKRPACGTWRAAVRHRTAHDHARRGGGVGAVGQRLHDLLGLAHHDEVDRQLGEHRARRRRAVRADRDEARHVLAAAPARGSAGTRQLGLGAAPEEIGRRRGEHRHVGRESRARARRAPRSSRPSSAPSSISTSWPPASSRLRQ